MYLTDRLLNYKLFIFVISIFHIKPVLGDFENYVRFM